MENEMVLLQKCLSALGTHVASERATAVGMALIVQHQAVLGNEALAAELTEMRFGFLLWRRCDLNDCGLLLRLLLGHLNGLLLNYLLLNLRRRVRDLLHLRLGLDLNLLRLLGVRLGLDLNLLIMLGVRWTLKDLVHHLARRSNDLNWHWRRRIASRLGSDESRTLW